MELLKNNSLRPAWIEVDLRQLHQNFEIINQDKPANLQILSVVKAQAYGHGAYDVAKAALAHGVKMLGVATIDEALELRTKGIAVPIMLFGERLENQFETCIQQNFVIFLNDVPKAKLYAQYAAKLQKRPTVHIEVDTGMSRYGVRWSNAVETVEKILEIPGIHVEGIMGHFAMSDELDKSYAFLQLYRFKEVLEGLEKRGIQIPIKHHCNSGGFLDLPHAHFDMVRIGILPLGVYPSEVCRRIPGIEPIMSVKARVVVVRDLAVGDKVGYGMRYIAETPRRIAVIPLGYGDGFPRVRNDGYVLIHGKRAPVVGGNAMDVMMVDTTDIPATQIGDEVVIMGQQGTETITARQFAKRHGTVPYDILANWNLRMPRFYLHQ